MSTNGFAASERKRHNESIILYLENYGPAHQRIHVSFAIGFKQGGREISPYVATEFMDGSISMTICGYREIPKIDHQSDQLPDGGG
jgi:hypothetical protein